MLLQSFLLFFISYPQLAEMFNQNNDHHQRRQTSSSTALEFTANVDYNKLYQRYLNINNARVKSIEPKDKLWFAIENGTIFALPLFGDYPGPFLIQFQQLNNHTSPEFNNLIELKLNFNFTPSSSLFYPSDHLLLAVFDMSSTTYNHSLLNRYFIVRTLSLALNLSESLLTIHRINGSMIKVYFSCDLYFSTNLSFHLTTLIDRYYSRRLQLLSLFPLPLIEISIVRLAKSTTIVTSTIMTTTTTFKTHMVDLRKGQLTLPPRLLNDNTMKFNRTVPPFNSLLLLKQFYQPLVIVPLSVIAVGLCICAIIACCLCCNRRSSSSSTLLLPNGTSTSPTNKHLYQNYSYRKHKQENEFYKNSTRHHDQRQFISKGIPVVFAEELDENIEQTHTPLVMRIEKAPANDEQEKASMNTSSIDDREITRELWQSRILICFILSDKDISKFHRSELPEPLYLTLPRITDKFYRYYSTYFKENLFDSTNNLWLDHLPWQIIIVHLSKFPENELIRFSDKESIEGYYMSTLKEADALKHKGQIVGDMRKRDHKQLWNSFL
ncbi:hypothetical protein I4U23_030639 [Adineta vaga]|nr:hypothetical protein I4U23_030639 [Adineta vaga]